ncbi:MAG: hypothetical protein E4H14_16185 [Candidatus Thorarchaeota archaeon]|nr:MAG: hypothetical protein E4H14_16185 [Candidatus Thorarchaeota archaeon]
MLEEQETSSIKMVRGCPCFKVFGDEKLCVNDDSVLEIEAIEVDPSIFSFRPDKDSMKDEQAGEGNICYAAIFVNYPDNKVYCISQGWILRIHGKDVPGNDLEDALQFLSTKEASATAEICSECLYKFILTLGDTFADLMTKKEKTIEIKKYVDKFSLKIAVKHSQMDKMMEPIGTENDIENGVDHFGFLRKYLIQLLEQQHYWSDLKQLFVEENSEFWIQDLLRKRERLARMEFQFYSQTLQLRDINDFALLLKMLRYILRSSDEILFLNEDIHDIIRSDKFKEIARTDDRLSPLASYAEKSRTVEHTTLGIFYRYSRRCDFIAIST